MIQIINITLYISQTLFQPLCSIRICSLYCRKGKNMTSAKLTAFHISSKPFVESLIIDNSMRSSYSWHIKCLTRSHERNGIILCTLGNHGKRNMMTRWQRQIGMNFIRKDNHIIFSTYVCNRLQLIVCPDHTARIVRIT